MSLSIAAFAPLAFLIALTYKNPDVGIPLLAAWAAGALAAFTLGHRTAVRQNGASMIRAGSHRLVKGRF